MTPVVGTLKPGFSIAAEQHRDVGLSAIACVAGARGNTAHAHLNFTYHLFEGGPGQRLLLQSCLRRPKGGGEFV